MWPEIHPINVDITLIYVIKVMPWKESIVASVGYIIYPWFLATEKKIIE